MFVSINKLIGYVVCCVMSESDVSTRLDKLSAQCEEHGCLIAALLRDVGKLSVAPSLSEPPVLGAFDESFVCVDILTNIDAIMVQLPMADSRVVSVLQCVPGRLLSCGVLTYESCVNFVSSRMKYPVDDFEKRLVAVFSRLTGLHIRSSPVNKGALCVIVCKFTDRVVFSTIRGGTRNTWPYKVRVEWANSPIVAYVREAGAK